MAHRLFADWHRAVQIDPNPVDLDARWTAIEAYVQQLTPASALALVRLAHEQPVDDAAAEAFAQAFKSKEPAFPMRANQRLIAMLAGSAIIHALARADRLAILLAYAVSASAPVGWQAVVQDLRLEATDFLSTQGALMREPSPVPSAIKIPGVLPKTLKDQIDGATDVPSLVKAVSEFAGKVEAARSGLASHLESMQNWAISSMLPLEEENDMLWWLLSGGSQLLSQDWAAAGASVAAIVAGWELAELVRVLPGPPSAHRLIRQLIEFGVGDDDKASTSTKKALGQLPKNITLPQLEDNVLDLTPLLCLAHNRLVRDEIADRPKTPLALGQEAYLERLLIRAHAQAT